MKIAIFATGHPDIKPAGGREQRVWQIAQYLGKKHDVIFICPGYGKHISYYNNLADINDINYHRYVPSEIKNNVHIYYTLPSGIKHHHLNILFTKIKYLFLVGINSKKIKADVWYCSRAPLSVIWTKARVIADCGRLWIWHWSPITLIDNFSNLLGFEYADKRIFNAEKNKRLADKLVLDEKEKGNNIVLNPGIDLSIFKPKKTKKIYDVLYVGRREKAKGYDDLLKIIKQHPNKKFKIAAGDIKKADMPKLYRQSKVLLLPSYGESYSQTVVEALACGTDVIAYNVIADELKPFCMLTPKGDWMTMSHYIDHPTPFIPVSLLIHRFDQKEYLKRIGETIERVYKDRQG